MDPKYTGLPYSDSNYHRGAQAIPGQVFCAYFDRGGEGVAFHTDESVNHGSGILNPVDGSYLNSFRIDEPIGTTYTKPDIDDTEFNLVDPELEMLYIGWTDAGQWYNYTVTVATTGDYLVSLLYTAARDGGAVSLSVDGVNQTGTRVLQNLSHERETIDWRQVHHWGRSELAPIRLEEGTHLLTLKVETSGQLNLATLDFRLK
jgi:hypothetical protein